MKCDLVDDPLAYQQGRRTGMFTVESIITVRPCLFPTCGFTINTAGNGRDIIERRAMSRPPRRPPSRPSGQPSGNERLWVGDGMAPAGPHLVGSPVSFHGRRGVVVETTLLKILVEWNEERGTTT